ncbi:hybrid signal transduction histidine kinase k [Fusarium langsethiae]|uniref:histidine kinase n=1 Tax=Fusarium langsethiae TaxID=179993 RepID=A0A0N0DCE2_FUSLA|nr:hybrid signal transduction histidine kinase k [Fusarium langsethiae]
MPNSSVRDKKSVAAIHATLKPVGEPTKLGYPPLCYFYTKLGDHFNMSESGKQQNTVTPTYDATSKIVPEATKVSEEHAKYLLAEDNKTCARMFCNLFNKLDLQSTYRHVWNGQEAVDVYKAHPEQCRIIFMDLAMPVMSGLEASLRIRDWKRSGSYCKTGLFEKYWRKLEWI